MTESGDEELRAPGPVPASEARARWTAALADGPVTLADGAMGTMLFAAGLQFGDPPEMWNLALPQGSIVRQIHRGYLDAGSRIILTNTFGGNRLRLSLHGNERHVGEVNRMAAVLARAEVDAAGGHALVAGDIGPSGSIMMPIGTLDFAEAVDVFAEQAAPGVAGGVDVIWIETMSSAEEIQAAASAAGKIGMPYVFTASFDTAGRTMMGLPPSQLHGVTADLLAKPLAIGANCGVGASDLLSSVLDLHAADPAAVLVAKANCGIPVIRGEKVVYSGTPETMAKYACLAIDAGARIIGGCCGTDCDHLAAMRKAIDSHVRGDSPTIEAIEAAIGAMVNTPAANDAAPRERRGKRRA